MRKLTLLFVIVALLFTMNTGLSVADETESCSWTCFKGNAQRTGVASTKYPPDKGRLRLLWKQRIDGKAVAFVNGDTSQQYRPAFSPVVSNGCVFVGSRIGALFCFDINSGKEKWSFKTPERSSIFSTPAIFKNKVLFGADDGVLYCLNQETGKLVWSYRTRKYNDEAGEYRESEAVIRSSPVIYENKELVLFGSNNTCVYCLRISDGHEEWIYGDNDNEKRMGHVFSSPAIHNTRPHCLYFISGSDNKDTPLRLFQLLVSEGRKPDFENEYPEICYTFESGMNKIYSSPVIYNNHILVGASNGVLYKFSKGKLETELFGDENEENEDKKIEIESTPSIYEDDSSNAYAIFGTQVKNSSRLVSVNIETMKMKWEKETKRFIRSSPAICDGMVYFGCHNGKLYCVDAETGKEAWHYQTPKYKAKNSKGETAWQPYAINSSPAIADGKVLIVSEDGYLYCFGERTYNNLEYIVGDNHYLADGEHKQMDVSPMIKDGRTLLPARYVVEPLGGMILWNNKTKTVHCEFQDKMIELPIGKRYAMVNGKQQILDTETIIYEGRTYVPLRFITETFDCDVNWDGIRRSVRIKYNPATE